MKAKAKVRNLATPPPPPSSPSFSSLPDEIIENCFARISISSYRSLSLVSKSFHSILSSPELYKLRSKIGNTEPRLYVFLQTPESHCWYTLEEYSITKDGEIKNELSLAPIKPFSSSSGSNSNPLGYVDISGPAVAVGSEIYQIGKRSRAVRVFDCRSKTWRCGPNMQRAKKRGTCALLDGKIYVMERCSYKEGEVFDIKTQTWKIVPSPSPGVVSECEVVVFGGKLCLTTKIKDYTYDPEEGRWLPELGFWRLTRIITQPCCVIENVIFTDCMGMYEGYNPKNGRWFEVQGLEDVYANRAQEYKTIHLVNFGGKLVIIWQEQIKSTERGRGKIIRSQDKRIWCAVVRLEKHELEIRGKIERCNVLFTGPESYKLWSCLSVSL